MSNTTEVIVKPIDVTEFTNNVTTDTIDYTVTGDGIFDKLMDTATKHLKAQFESNRIREEDYASAYIQIYQSNLGLLVISIHLYLLYKYNSHRLIP